MLIDCHVHTTRYSGCSTLSPKWACEWAEDRGLDVLVLTEHQVQWTTPEIAILRKEYPGLKIFSGVEVSLEEGFDVVLIASIQGLTYPPFPHRISLAEFQDSLRVVRGERFAFIAHPFRWTNQRSLEMDLVLAAVDGIEMSSINILHNNVRREKNRYVARNATLYQQAREEYGLIPLYNTDSHTEGSVGALANRVDGQIPATGSELAALLKRAHPEEYQNQDLLKRFF
ncbi:MAG: PHP domain-containing protein [Desulfovibrionales bacterium]